MRISIYLTSITKSHRHIHVLNRSAGRDDFEKTKVSMSTIFKFQKKEGEQNEKKQ